MIGSAYTDGVLGAWDTRLIGQFLGEYGHLATALNLCMTLSDNTAHIQRSYRVSRCSMLGLLEDIPWTYAFPRGWWW